MANYFYVNKEYVHDKKAVAAKGEEIFNEVAALRYTLKNNYSPEAGQFIDEYMKKVSEIKTKIIMKIIKKINDFYSHCHC